MTNPCRCWLTSPPIPHSGHCCLRDDPTPLADLDAIAVELKGANLGGHRARLQGAWSARKSALKSVPVDAPADADYGDLLDAAVEGDQ